MEAVSGMSAVDSDGRHEVHYGQVPLDRRSMFYPAMAKIQVRATESSFLLMTKNPFHQKLEMTSIRLPMIGMVVQDSANNFTVGPCPDIGGPFQKATDFIEAWAEHCRFSIALNCSHSDTIGTLKI